MEATKIRQAIDSGKYTIDSISDCGCNITWSIEGDELVPDVSSDTCYEGQSLVIDGESIAEYIRYEGLSDNYNVDDYPDDYDGDDDDDSLRSDITTLIKIGEMADRGESGRCTEHDDKMRDTLKDYIEELAGGGWMLYRDNERGFANEYVCILVAPDADKDEIDDDWDKLTVETWVSDHLYAGDAATDAYNSVKVIS